MSQWRGIEAAGVAKTVLSQSIGDSTLAVHGLGSEDSALEPIVDTRSSPDTNTVRIQNILNCYNTFELVHVGTVHNWQ